MDSITIIGIVVVVVVFLVIQGYVVIIHEQGRRKTERRLERLIRTIERDAIEMEDFVEEARKTARELRKMKNTMPIDMTEVKDGKGI